MKLTKTDKEVLDFIKKYMLENDTTPTIRDICTGMGYYSTSTAYAHFAKLIDLGYVIPIQEKGNKYRVKGMRYTVEM